MKKRLLFASETACLAGVRAEVRAFIKDCGFDDTSEILMVLALDEACTNIIRHAYCHARKPVRLEMRRHRDRIRFILRDYGRSCDPGKIRSRALEDIRPGGLGVHIIRQAFDHVDYAPQRRGTKLTLEKLLPNEREGDRDRA